MYSEFRYAQIIALDSLPSSPPSLSAWTVTYPAAFAADAANACDGGAAATGLAGGSVQGQGQFESSSVDLNAIWDFCEYTVRVANLDMVTDSNTRQCLLF